MCNRESFKLRVLNEGSISDIIRKKYEGVIDSELNRIYNSSIEKGYELKPSEVAQGIGFIVRDLIKVRQEDIMKDQNRL